MFARHTEDKSGLVGPSFNKFYGLMGETQPL